MELSNFLLFIGAAAIICIVPGPDMLYIIANGVHRGPKGGIVASLGLAVGMLFHTTAVTLGLAILVTTSPIILQIIKVVGAAYLFYIGFSTFKDSKSELTLNAQRQEVSLLSIFKRAIVTNVLNPKVAIFFLVFLPQFVPKESGSPQFQLFIYGISFLVIGLLVDSSIGFASGKVKDFLANNDVMIFRLNIFSASIFCFLGLIQIVGLFV